jgi:hypothetical protein
LRFIKGYPKITAFLAFLFVLVGIGGTIWATGSSTLTVAVNPAGNIPEGVGNASFEVRLSDPIADGQLTVRFSTANGVGANAATAPADFTSVVTTVTFLPGDIVKTVPVPIIDDSNDETNENFQVTLDNLNNTSSTVVSIGSSPVAVVIADNDSPTFDSLTGPATVNEDAGTAIYTITMTPAGGGTVISPQPVTFDYVVTGSGANPAEIPPDPNADVVVASGTWIIPANQPLGPVTFPLGIVDDAFDEPDETYTVQITAVTNVANPSAATAANATTTIIDDDVPTIAFTASGSTVAENAGTVVVTASLDILPLQNVTFDFAVGGASIVESGDYSLTPAPGTLTINAGADPPVATIQVTVNDDAIFEPSEDLVLVLSNPSSNATLGTQDTYTLTITDNDTAPTVNISAPAPTNEGSGGGTTPFEFTVNVSGQTELPITLTASASGGGANPAEGSDFTLVTTNLVITPPAASGTITVNVTADAIYEADETFAVTISSADANATVGTASATATILNDDSAPSVSIATPAPVTEGSGGGTTPYPFTVNVSGQTEVPITLNVSASGSGADLAEGSDFTLVTTNLVITPPAASGTITVSVTADAIYEADETFDVTISSANANATVGTASATGTINDDDSAPSVSIATPAPVTEGSGGGTTPYPFTVNVSGSTELPISLNVSASGSGADPAESSDFTLVTTNLVIAPPAASGTITVNVTADNIYELDETFTVTISSADANATVGTTSATGTIDDDDSAPSVSIATPAPVTEDSGGGTTPYSFTVNVSGSTEAPITLIVSATGSGADPAEAADFTLVTTNLVITPPAASGTITVNVTADNIYEANETVDVTISSADANATVGTASATGTINDDDAQPTLSITAPAPANEGNSGTTPFNFTISLSGTTELPVDVNYSLIAVDTNTSDYNAPSGTLNIPAGQTSGTITVQVVGDTTYEPDEDFTIQMDSATGATLGAPASATATILNDDLPTVQFSATSSAVTEDSAGTVNIQVELSQPVATGDTISVPFSIAGTAGNPADYTVAPATTLTFNAGDQLLDLAVTVTVDTLDEDNETVVITLGTSTGATLDANTTYTLTINDDDPAPTVDFASATSTVNEGAGSASIAVNLSAASGRTVTVNYALGVGSTATAADFTLTPGTLTFNPGVTTANIPLTISEDLIDENPDETVVIALSGPSNATLGGTNNPHTLTIVDNDGPPTVLFDLAASSVAEDGGTATVNIVLSNASAQTITVDYATANGTAVAGTDYVTATGTLTFTAGVVTQTVTVSILDNALYQNDRQFTIGLSNPSAASGGLGAIQTHTVTIEDDDGPTINFTPASATIAENGGTVVVTMTLDQPIIPGDNPTVNLNIGGTATNGTDFAVSATSVTFNPSYTNATVSITLNDDAFDELDETAVLTLSAPAGVNMNLGADSVYTLTISDDDETPTAADDSYATDEDVNLVVIAANGVLANDSDADVGDVLTAALVSDPSNGALTLNSDGSFTYTPTANFHGTDTFTYQASDTGSNTSAVATVTITVNPVNDPPEAVDDTAALSGAVITIDVLANDSDPDGDPLIIAAVTQGAKGTVAITGGVELTYTPNADFTGTDSFTYTISDGNSGVDSATVTVALTDSHVMIPIVMGAPKEQPPGQPDLVASFTVNPASPRVGEAAQITVTVTNTGAGPTGGGFWVDFYINPSQVPEVNKPWDQICGLNPCYGIAWYVAQSLAPGQSITLISTADSYFSANTIWPGSFASGTSKLYLLVDSWNRSGDSSQGDPNGSVVEANESNNLFERDITVTGTSVVPSNLPRPADLPLRPVHPAR